MILGDLGADVIKIEHPVRGDGGRGMMRVLGILTGAKGGRNYFFETFNRNKRGITLDLTKPEGREIFYELAKESDVILENFRPGVTKKLGADYDAVSKHNPKIIYVSGSAFGEKGPDSQLPGFDYLGLARSGSMYAFTGGPKGMQPIAPLGGIADQLGGTMMAFGAITALYARDRFGKGQKVTTSHLTCMMWLYQNSLAQMLQQGVEHVSYPREEANNPLWNHYRCGDGKWLAMAHIQSDRQWPAVCKAMGIESLRNDPKFANADVRKDNSKELVGIFDEIFATKSREEWIRIFRATDKDLIVCEVNKFTDLLDDPQVIANNYFEEIDYPVLGRMKLQKFCLDFSKSGTSIRMPAPEFGQHTEEVLLEVLGYDWEKIVELKDKEII
jgi:crotonobetainyl-CoA:carnitine CoA-transferase CaiB-like acyl-CoA transferase